MRIKTILPVTALMLLTGALLLAGCEKEQPQIEETHNLLKKDYEN